MSASARSVYLFSLSQDPAALKEEGNTLFKAGDMEGAVCCYTKALKLCDRQAESAVLYRNRSACYLKLEEYSNAEADASKGGMTLRPRYIKGYFSQKYSVKDIPQFIHHLYTNTHTSPT